MGTTAALTMHAREATIQIKEVSAVLIGNTWSNSARVAAAVSKRNIDVIY